MKTSLRILIADDEPAMCEYLQEFLPRLGHEVAGVARTGKELIEKCLALHPDLIITDIKMPDIDGLGAAQELENCLVPIIVVSAYFAPDLIERARKNFLVMA